MRTGLMVLFAMVVALLGTLILFIGNRGVYVAALTLGALMIFGFRKLGRPWWFSVLLFALMGISHLVALWSFRARAEAAGAVPALQTFGPVYLLIAAYFARGRWFSKPQSE